MSKPPFSAQKALKSVTTSQKIEGYQPTTNKTVKAKAQKIASKK